MSTVSRRPGAPARRARNEYVLTGGGTAGHVLPALAVARALVARGWAPGAIHFVGARQGMEARLVPEAGFAITLLPGRGFRRRLSAANLRAATGLLAGFLEAFALLIRRRPRAVCTVGGYAGVACSLAAGLLRIPVVVVNLDAVPGAANRLVGRFAAASAVAIPGTPLPRAVCTGAPVRPEILGVDRSPAGRARARELLGLDADRLVVAVTGGSLGAGRLNDAALGLAADFAGRRDLTLYHVAGERNRAAVAAAAARLGLVAARGLDYRVVGYESHQAELLAAADVVVCRAGASTVADLWVIGTPAIVVPLPGAPGDHQTRNAAALAVAGAGVVVADRDLTPERLRAELEVLLEDPERRAQMSLAAGALGRPDAADAVAALLERVARPPRALPGTPGVPRRAELA